MTAVAPACRARAAASGDGVSASTWSPRATRVETSSAPTNPSGFVTNAVVAGRVLMKRVCVTGDLASTHDARTAPVRHPVTTQ